MKPCNFPARKLKRQIDATRDRSKPYTDAELTAIEEARRVRTKKVRSSLV